MPLLRKPRLYLDTSVISHLRAEDVPEKMADTLALWGLLEAGDYETLISSLTAQEIDACANPKREYLMTMLVGIPYARVEITHEMEMLADQLIYSGVLSRKSYDDCLHIAAAVVNRCDYLVSWNFKHLVNIKTVSGVRAINILSGYQNIDIITPSMIVGGDMT